MSHFFIQEIDLKQNHSQPLYLQLSNALATLIKKGVLKPGFQLPGTRTLASLLGLNRNTVISALDELTSEGWVTAERRRGYFVNSRLPVPHHQKIHESVIGTYPKKTPYPVHGNFPWELPVRQRLQYEFNDGFPDLRLAPVQEIRKEYTTLLNTAPLRNLLSYADPRGDKKLRESIARLLKKQRGMDPRPEQVMITRGSIMGLYMLSQILVQQGDCFAMGWPGYRGAQDCFKTAGCRILNIPVDEKGMDTGFLEKKIGKNPVKALYVTSHHQHPTTVSLAPERRMHLLQLAQRHHFAIIEDDYDYEFHYENKPLLPIASADNSGSVIYIGSFSKTLYPSLRLGYLVGPESLINTLASLRFIIDNNGDTVLERVLSRFIDSGAYSRHIRKSLKQYRERKNILCTILDRDFTGQVSYKEPEGGMVVWAHFNHGISLDMLTQKCLENGLLLNGSNCHNLTGNEMNATRLGFASMNETEIEKASAILKRTLNNLPQAR